MRMKVRCSSDQMGHSLNGERQVVELTGSGDMTVCPPGRPVSATPVQIYPGPQKTRITRWGKLQYLSRVIIIFVLGFLLGAKCDI